MTWPSPANRGDHQQHLGDLVIIRTGRQRPGGAPFRADCRCAFNLFWAMRRGMAEDEHEGRHRIAGLLGLPARHSCRAKRWFLGEEAVVSFHPIRDAGGSPGSAVCAWAS